MHDTWMFLRYYDKMSTQITVFDEGIKPDTRQEDGR